MMLPLPSMHAPLLDLVHTAFRSWWTIVAAIFLGLTSGVLLLDYLPKKYEAKTTIWVSQQKLPESVARTNVSDEMSRRLVIFRAAVLKDEYMIELIKRTYGLPESAEELAGLIASVRSRIDVDVNAPRRRSLIAFELTYRDVDPQRAARTVNTLAELYVAQHEEFRTGQAERTAQMVESMAAAAEAEFSSIDEQLRRFKLAHLNESEAALEDNRERLATSESELKAVRDQWDVANVRIEHLQVQMEMGRMFRSRTPTDSSGMVDPTSRRIAEIQKDLDSLRVRYSERHPDYVRKKRELEDVLASARSREPVEEEDEEDMDMEFEDPQSARLATEITILEQTQNALKTEEARLRKEIAEYRRRISAAPEVQRELDEIERRHAIAKDKYVRLERDAEKVRAAVALEESEMGQRMEILEAASVPMNPYSPVPMQIYVMCLVLSCGLFIGPVLARSYLRPLVVSEAGFGLLSELPVLSCIPTIDTAHNQRARRSRMFKNLALASLSCIVFVGAKLYTGFGVG